MNGCGGSSGPPLARVSGVITIDGKPLRTGSVQFIPDADKGTTGRMAVGSIDAKGNYTLTTQKSGDGAQIGHHIVLVQSYENVPAPKGYHSPFMSKPLIPEWYTDPKQSDLRTEVKKGENNVLSFDLVSK